MGKRLKNIISENDFSKSYSVEEAADMAIKTATTKFNETIDICMNLNTVSYTHLRAHET